MSVQIGMDYIFFVYGLSCFLLAGICLCLRRGAKDRMPWGSLAWFGIIHGLREWCELLALSAGDSPAFTVVRTCLMMLSFAFLLEFGRAGMGAARGRAIRRWVLVPFLCPAGLGALAGPAGVDAASRYALGLTGGVWAAAALLRYRRAYSPASRSLLTVAVGWGLYAGATGLVVPKAPFFPASIINHESFLAVVGIPIQLFRASLAILVTVATWQYYQTTWLAKDEAMSSTTRSGWWLAFALGGILTGGWISASVIGRISERNMDAGLIARAQLSSATLDPSVVGGLTGTAADLGKPDYESLKAQLGALRHANCDCRFQYLLVRKGAEIAFLADSEPSDSPECSPAGQIYQEAPADLVAFFESPQPFRAGPYADRWGVWVSGFVPVRDRGTGKLVAALGMDIDARDWHDRVCADRLPPIGVTLLIALLVTGFFVVQQKSREAALRIAISEDSHRSLVESSPNNVALCDHQGRYLAINGNGLDAMGREEADLVGRPYASVWPEESRRAVQQAVGRALQGEPSSFETDYCRPDGRMVTWHTVLTPVRPADQVVGRRFVAIGIDITDQKQKELQQARRLTRLQSQQSATVELVTNKSFGSTGIECAAPWITELTARALEVARSSIWLLSEDRQSLRCVDLHDRLTGSHLQGLVLNAQDHPRYFEALETGRALDIGDALHDPRTSTFAAAYLASAGITSMLDAGVRVGGEVVGVLCAEHVGAPRDWQDDEITFAGAIADQVAHVLMNAKRQQAEEALREGQARLQTILNTIPAGVVLIEAETHTIVDVNPAALAILGARREEVTGKLCHRYICPAQAGQCPLTDLGQTVDNSERILLRVNRERVPILKTVVSVMLDGRRHLLESFVDITGRKRAEEELAAHRERLEELVSERTRQLMEAERTLYQQERLASVGQLAAGVAHEINTPIQYVGDNLNALSENFDDLITLGNEYRELVELVQAGSPTGTKIEAIRKAEHDCALDYILEDTPKAISQGLEGVKRVARIVAAMKDFSHTDTGERSAVDLNQCIKSTLTVARSEYKYVADVETDLSDLPLVECYASEMNQVFLNLLVNAAHAIGDTKQRGQITVRTQVLGDEVVVAIHDTGTGIPEPVRKKIFDPFFTTKEVGKRTGQGLYLTRQIVVQKHGGTISFETEMGKGTTFFVRLPVRIQPKAEARGAVAQR